MKKPLFYTHPINHHLLPPPPLNHHPNYETALIDEVLYLHSLWRRGPPNPSPSPYLKPIHTTHFKKKTSDKPWPVPKPGPTLPGSGPSWPAFPAQNKPVTRPATGPELARALGLRIQLNGVESCCGLFRGDGGDDDDDDEEEEEEEEEDGDDEEELDFFEKLFEEEKELREFYVRNCENGEFYCLVCGVLGNKKNNNINLGRKYKNCVALVQHSMSVSKTKKKKAHRVYGNVVCKVLGWDVNRLPSLPIFVDLGDPTSLSPKDEAKNHAAENSTVVEMETDAVTKPIQSETDTTSDALEKTNVPSTNATCIAIEVTHADGEVKNQNDVDNTAVEMVGDAANASRSQAEPEGIPDMCEKGNIASTDVRCIASALTHSENERKDSSNGCKTDDRDREKDEVCANSEDIMSGRVNDPNLGCKENVKKLEKNFSVLDSKPVECESSVAGKDPYEQLECLPGVFKIPE